MVAATLSFLGLIVDGIASLGASPETIEELTTAFARVSDLRPDLAQRYAAAVEARDTSEIERLFFDYRKVARGLEEAGQTGFPYLSHVRINAASGVVHIGHGLRGFPIFAERPSGSDGQPSG